MVPFFRLMTLTILLERLQLLQRASIREPERARGSFLWQHAVIATLRFLTFPRARFWTSSTQNIASASKPTDFTQRRTNQSSLFRSTPRRPASSVWETFPLHKFMGSSAQKNRCGIMWCKIGCGTPTSSTSSLPQSRSVTTIRRSRISWMIAGWRMTAMIMLEFQASGSASTCASPAAPLARTREADRRSRSQRASGSRRSLPALSPLLRQLRRRPLRLGARPHRVVRRVPGSSIWRAAPNLRQTMRRPTVRWRCWTRSPLACALSSALLPRAWSSSQFSKRRSGSSMRRPKPRW